MRQLGRQSRPPQTRPRRALGQTIQRLRDEAGISQEQLALKIGMSRRYLSGIERGEANPTLDQLARVAKGLKVEIRDLF